MINKYILPLVALVGILSAVHFSTTYGRPQDPQSNLVSTPPSSDYENTVSGIGIVEANTRNIDIGSHIAGVVGKIFVEENTIVKKGDPLYSVDKREAEANLESAKATVAVAESDVSDAADQFKRAESLKAGSSITVDALQRRRFLYEKSKALLTQAKAQLKLAETELELRTVTSPIDGKILKLRIREGEFLDRGKAPSPITMGNDNPLHLRVSIDENDIYRFKPESAAKAALRSNKDISFDLKFVRLEPYVQPKRELSGSSSERVDTRVIEVVYSFQPEGKPVFIGQQMDVFVDAK